MATNPGHPSSHPFTCNTCQVAFRTSETQRGHMQSDWHRYNLKRRIASLPPISSEIFAEKVLANKASQAAVAAKASFTRECPACHKTYFSENAYTNHLASQRHRQNELRLRAGSVGESMLSSAFSITGDTDTASVASTATARGEKLDPDAEDEFAKMVDGIKTSRLDEGGVELPSQRPSRPHHSAGPDDQRPEHPISPIPAKSNASGSETPTEDPLLTCLFCNLGSDTVDSNVLHMQKDHSMFIPEKNYLVDLPGLLVYLREKVTILNECLYCGQQKRTTEACQTHMLDKGHCMIAFGTEDEQLEIGEFFDFRTTYSAGGESDEEDEDEDDAASQASWETASVSSGDSDEDIPEVDETEKTRRALVRAATARGPKAVYFDDVEMHLGNGRSVGHRSWNRVWRQRLATRHNPVDDSSQGLVDGGGDTEMGSPEEADTDAGALTRREKRDEVFRRGRQGRPSDALITRGEGGMLGVTAQTREEVRAEEKRSRRTEERQTNKFRAVREKKGNSQKHFRDHLLQ